MREDAPCLFRRRVVSDDGDNKYDDSQQRKYLNMVNKREIKGIGKAGSVIGP